MRRGDVIGDRFEIGEYVASGGMGRVFRARDLQSGEIVALKVLIGDLRELGSRFDRESQALASLSHPGIVRYVAHGVAAPGQPYLAMEWLEGEDLASRLSRGRLSLEDSLALATRVAEAVHVAHARDIVHRDLKPSNLFLVDGRIDRVKVLDFGIARFVAGTRVTGTGMMIGTPGYMAPEQAATDRPINPRADVFSLGCVLFECLTGVYAFAAEHPMALLAKVMFAEPQRLRDVLPAAPAALDALLWRMMAKDPAARPLHGGAVAEALAALGSHVDAGAAARSSIALTRDEQRMFSIVLVGEAGEDGVEASGPSAVQETQRMRMDATLREGAASWGGRLERLRDGSLVVAIGGSGLVTDQATQAARCALWLRARMAGHPVALATGRGDRSGRLPAAEIIDRAAALLRPGSGGTRAAGDGVAIDEVTARLLDARFDVRERGSGYVLFGEHALVEGTRMLLGRATPCVGRELEVRALEQLFEECIEESAARAAIVTAPPGTGKSRLAQEFLRTIGVRGDVAVWSCRGEPHRAGSAFSLLSQLIRGACGIQGSEPLDVQRDKLVERAAVAAEPVRSSGGEEGRATSAIDAEPVRRIAEFLGEIAGVAFPDDDSLPLRAARQDAWLMNEQMRAAFLDFLRAETGAHLVVLVLEDVHWGDRPTVQFLDVALRDLRERPLFVLALARPEVHQLFPKLWAERAIQELPLKQLGKKASERLVRHVLGEGTERDLVDRLVRLSEGNAFYLEELIRAAAEGQRGDLPETVVAMVQSRLDALDDEARRILRAASVFGEVFWAGAVARLLGIAGRTTEFEPRLAELADRELIGKRAQCRFPEEEEYAFRHALLREGAYTTLTDDDRTLGHRLAGDWLEQHGEQDPLALAEHFERGGQGARAGRHYLRAAEQAHLAGDTTAALARAKQALGHDLPDELRIRCLGVLCELLYFAMDLQRDALPYAEELVRVAPRGSAPWYQGLLVKSAAHLHAGDVGEVVRLVEMAAAVTPAPGAATARTLCVASGAFSLDLLGRAHTVDHLVRLLAADARTFREGEPMAEVQFYSLRAIRMAYADEDPWQGLQHAKTLLDISERVGERRFMEIAKLFIGMNRWYLGALDGVERTIADVALSGLISSYRPFLLAWLLADRGSLDEARRWVDRLIEAGEARHLLIDSGRGHWALAEVLRRGGDRDGADAAIGTALAILRGASPLDMPGALATLAAVRLAQGRTAEAVTTANEGLETYEAMAACGFFRGAYLRLIHAECLQAAGDHEAAKAAITAARSRLFAIAAKIGDREYRKSFLEDVSENRRTLELARQWVGPDESS